MIVTDQMSTTDSFVAAWLPGTEGDGVAEVLFGDYNFTGKLPFSWPRTMAQIPINVGDTDYDPLFAYGFGLEYPIEVDIDIKPGGETNPVSCTATRAQIPVAILSTVDFEATMVDHTTVTFAGAGESHIDKATGLARRHEADVNGDGLPDLVFHFRTGDTDLTCDSTTGTLTGQTLDGHPILGVGTVTMVPK